MVAVRSVAVSKSFRETLQFGRSGFANDQDDHRRWPRLCPRNAHPRHAGAGMDTDFMNAFAVGLADQGLRSSDSSFPTWPSAARPVSVVRQTGSRFSAEVGWK